MKDKDGKISCISTENTCYMHLQNVQSFSADWAIKNNGWKIEPYYDAPNTATHYSDNPDGSVAAYYRYHEYEFSDKTKTTTLQYFSIFNQWNSTTERDPEQFAQTRLKKLDYNI